jgi:predicted GIY-YIG superfamily endonuclease
MPAVYILQSDSGRFYIGCSERVSERVRLRRGGRLICVGVYVRKLVRHTLDMTRSNRLQKFLVTIP